jgi:long-chain acyl-CoA synthetase
VALIVLDPEACAAHAAAQRLPDGSVAALSRDPGVAAAVAGAVERANQQLARVEQIKRHTILPHEWPAGGRELTPTMKLKRKPIANRYQQQIEELYAPADAQAPTEQNTSRRRRSPARQP